MGHIRRYLVWAFAIAAILLAVVVLLRLTPVPGIAASSVGRAVLSNGMAGATVGLIGVLYGQYLAGLRHRETLLQTSELEAQRAHEAELQKYFEQVGQLLIEQPLRDATPDDNLSIVVRAQTLAALEGLDPDRKRILLLFLYEAALIRNDNPVVSLSAANLSGANLNDANLRGANLTGANLSGANLSRADFRGANLKSATQIDAVQIETNLRGANLSHTELGGADLIGAILKGANLSKAFLRRADLSAANLIGANLRGAILKGAYLSRASLSGANLSDADLSDASLSGANLGDADLSNASLSRAHVSRAILSHSTLSGVDLSDACLVGAKGVNSQNLEQAAKSLEGTTMPDGWKHD